MQIEKLLVRDVRVLQSVELRLVPGLNVFVGANGSGKTSLLEAVHLLSYGRSFRAGGRDVLVRRGAEAAQVYAGIRSDSGAASALGIERSGSSWRGRVNDADVGHLSDLYRLCAVSCFEPGSHELISGPSELRRATFDWGVFHVEQEFLPLWRRYQRALKQRNALLKDQAPDDWFPAWEQELGLAAFAVQQMRQRYAAVLAADVQTVARDLLPEFSGAKLELYSGWKHDSPESVEDATARLSLERGRDRERGFTRRGPHRADWSLSFDQIPRREHLSRGQEKLSALVLILAQMMSVQRSKHEWPILLLDDPASELDAAHQSLVLEWIRRWPIQVLLTGTTVPGDLLLPGIDYAMFHVEQGRIKAGASTRPDG
jgi:DNA replication and repair protein RecF